MKLHKVLAALLVPTFLFSTAWLPAVAAPGATPQLDTGTVRHLQPRGSVTYTVPASGADINGVQANELAPAFGDDAGAPSPQTMAKLNKNFAGVNRASSRGGGNSQRDVPSGKDDHAQPLLTLSFDGINHRDQRLANGGNQFSLEPPDQGLCAGNDVVLETINDALRVFHSNGSPATGVVDLNTFYGYPAAINRTTGARGPFITDPSCLFDQATQRWFHVVLTLDVDPASGAFVGSNHLDLAVSQSADPTGSWFIYTLPVQDDGTQGTPDHGCPLNDDGTGHGPCLGDYPHMGADTNGFYLTTNEYAFAPTNTFMGAQVYAFSKQQLVAGGAVTVVQFNTAHSAPGGKPGFTIWPAQGPSSKGDDKHGTEYFLSSTAADEAQCTSGVNCQPGTRESRNILLWAMNNTASLNAASPAVTLANRSVKVDEYAVPPLSNQKAGDFPLGQCINDTTLFGAGCWQLLFAAEPAHDEVISHIDSNDTRMQQVSYVNGLVWGALDTDVKVNGQHKAGIEYFAVRPNGELAQQGTVALKGNNLTYPAIGMLPNGKGVMAFTVLGDTHYPSAGYASLDAHGVGTIHIAAEGKGPDDGFTSYKAEVGDPPRTRWGDYGATAVAGGTIWIASEYIGQTCTLTQWVSGSVGSCGGTRTALANWDTRISRIIP